MNLIYKLVVILSGAVLFVFNMRQLTKKKMDLGIGSWWAVASVILIIFGAVFNFTVLEHLIRLRNLLLLFLLAASAVVTLYLYGLHISRLKKVTDSMCQWVSFAKSQLEAAEDVRQEQEPSESALSAPR